MPRPLAASAPTFSSGGTRRLVSARPALGRELRVQPPSAATSASTPGVAQSPTEHRESWSCHLANNARRSVAHKSEIRRHRASSFDVISQSRRSDPPVLADEDRFDVVQTDLLVNETRRDLEVFGYVFDSEEPVHASMVSAASPRCRRSFPELQRADQTRHPPR